MSDQELFLNLALARRIEMAEAQAAVECTETYERLRPGSNTAVERIGGGFAIYCGPNLPTTQAVGLGFDGPISEEEFDRLEEFYRSRAEAVRVESCPLADLSLFGHFGRRGYRATEFSSVMARSMPTQMKIENWDAPAAGVAIEKVDREHFELWTFTVAQGFAEHYPVTQELLNVMKMFAQGASAECYLARIDGKVAGGAFRSQHAPGVSQSRRANGVVKGATGAGRGGGLRSGGEPRATGKRVGRIFLS